jgi:predicted ribosomally synthesized peptide with nif11-like leader
MSVADLKAYGERAAADPVVRKKAKEIGLQNVKGQADYAKTLGFHFTPEDMLALAKEVRPSGELSEGELAAVSGGVVTTTAMAVVGAGVAVGTAVTAVTASTSAGGW